VRLSTWIVETYRRAWKFILAAPYIVAIPLLAELLQHFYEITAGLYVSGTLSPEARRIRLGFGVVKIADLVLTILIALRWWRFRADWRRIIRPRWRFAAGLGALILLEMVGDSLSDAVTPLLAFAKAQPTGIRVAIHQVLPHRPSNCGGAVNDPSDT
jgi:hypothetical protein